MSVIDDEMMKTTSHPQEGAEPTSEGSSIQGVCGLLGTRWPDRLHAPPEAPFGLGTKRTLAEYQGVF